jgi:hypothetical protein
MSRALATALLALAACAPGPLPEELAASASIPVAASAHASPGASTDAAAPSGSDGGGHSEHAELPPSAASLGEPDEPTSPPPCSPEPPLPPDEPSALSDAALLQALRTGAPIGSASIGAPSRGSLLGAVELVPKGPDGIELFARSGKHPFATQRVVRLLERALREVHRCHPGGHRVHVGDLSRETGGPLAPHRSHQSGLDADVGFFYRTQEAWYVAPVGPHGSADLLDVPRTWALLRALLDGGSVEVVYLDLRVQRLLAPHAKLHPGALELDAVFDLDAKKDKLLRHEWGHHTHFHVRFTDPAATALGARVERLDPRGLVRAQGLAAYRGKLGKGRR